MTPRTVTLALVDRAGHPLGSLPLGEQPTPWWQDVADVVEAAKAKNLDVTILRLLATDQPAPPGGAVTYLAERAGPPTPTPGPDTDQAWTTPHPLRMPWAIPGGPTKALTWAEHTLATTVHTRHQIRTWNLSSIWRLDTATGPMWLKEVPLFHRHEAAVINHLTGPTTPRLIAADSCRMLLADIPGTDSYGAQEQRTDMLAALLAIQTTTTHQVAELLAKGVPDHRTTPLTHRITHAIDTTPLPQADRTELHHLTATLTELAECGVPDTLVHGDFHPGNVRTEGGRHVILDWADSAIGNPVFDLIRLQGDDPDPHLTAQWCGHWHRAAPGSDPERAAELAARLAPLNDAATYAAFLAGIEPTEHPYHAADVPQALAAALQTSRHA